MKLGGTTGKIFGKNGRQCGRLQGADRDDPREDLLMKGPKVVAVGGGTGLSTMLRGLKQFTSNITAVVTVADDGGGSGVLRQELGMLPPGDIRNCILALADTEPLMEQLLQYRFKDGKLKGQSFGTSSWRRWTASHQLCGSGQEESDVLAVTGGPSCHAE